MDLYTLIFVICMAILRSGISTPVSVLDFGAVGDGKTDDSQAFMKAWGAVCGATEASSLVIPMHKTFFLQPVQFPGPCKSPNIQIEIQGTIVAPSKMSDWRNSSVSGWIMFLDVNGLTVEGTGLIDGQGADWWKNCGSADCQRPIELKFDTCNNLTVSGLRLINSPRAHITIYSCNYASISNINITSPEDSPNTDGIDISHSTNVFVQDCNIGTGDDCIAIITGSSYINITKVTCGPGHGISVGSLGKNGQTDTVEEVHVQSCTFYSTQNGAHIKTWQGGLGYARKISYQDITLIGTHNPIFIDQYYCPDAACANQTNAVKISEVSFTGFQGTSGTETAINLSCSENVGCTDIVLDHNNITSAVPSKPASSYCLNAHGTSTDTFPPVSLPQTLL